MFTKLLKLDLWVLFLILLKMIYWGILMWVNFLFIHYMKIIFYPSYLSYSGGALYHFIFALICISIFRVLLLVLEVFCGHFYQHLLHLMRSISRLFNFKEFIAFWRKTHILIIVPFLFCSWRMVTWNWYWIFFAKFIKERFGWLLCFEPSNSYVLPLIHGYYCRIWCRSPSVLSFGIGKVLLMVLSGAFFAAWRVNSHLELLNFYSCYPHFVKERGLRNVCK